MLILGSVLLLSAHFVVVYTYDNNNILSVLILYRWNLFDENNNISNMHKSNTLTLIAIIFAHNILDSVTQDVAGSVENTTISDAVLQQVFNFTSAQPSEVTPNPVVVIKPPLPTIVPPINSRDGDNKTCIRNEGEKGECVTQFQCGDNSTTSEEEIYNIDIREGNGACKSYLHVCCRKKRSPEEIVTPAVKVREGCGWRNEDGVGFRISGDEDNEAEFGEFPWMVAILKLDPEEKSMFTYSSGGSLIHPSVVLTAAHSVASVKKSPSQLKVRAGEWDTKSDDEVFPYQELAVSEVIVHEEFSKGTGKNDIALVFLSSPVQMDSTAPHIGVACLPPPGAQVRDSLRCVASGWGAKNFTDPSLYQSILKKVELPVMDHNTCQERLRNAGSGPKYNLHSSLMCAGGEGGRDTCRGDGGSPLMCPIEGTKDRYMQFGIVSWGHRCGQVGIPGVYADVANLRDWVDSKIIDKGYDPKTYTYL